MPPKNWAALFFAHDRTDKVKWIPITFGTTIDCVLATRNDDCQETIRRFIEITKEIYETHKDEKEKL